MRHDRFSRRVRRGAGPKAALDAPLGELKIDKCLLLIGLIGETLPERSQVFGVQPYLYLTPWPPPGHSQVMLSSGQSMRQAPHSMQFS